jgi:hypothetical protein
MTPTLCNICLWMAVTCKKSLDQLFTFEFERFVLTSPPLRYAGAAAVAAPTAEATAAPLAATAGTSS